MATSPGLAELEEDGEERFVGHEVEARDFLFLLVELGGQLGLTGVEHREQFFQAVHAALDDAGFFHGRLVAHFGDERLEARVHVVELARGLGQVLFDVGRLRENWFELVPVLLQLVELRHERVDCVEVGREQVDQVLEVLNLLLLVLHVEQVAQTLVDQVDDVFSHLERVDFFLEQLLPVDGFLVPLLLDIVEILFDFGLVLGNFDDVLHLFGVLYEIELLVVV